MCIYLCICIFFSFFQDYIFFCWLWKKDKALSFPWYFLQALTRCRLPSFCICHELILVATIVNIHEMLSRYQISSNIGGKARLVRETSVRGVEGAGSFMLLVLLIVPSFGWYLHSVGLNYIISQGLGWLMSSDYYLLEWIFWLLNR